jgi:hypothetical protein
MYRTLPVWYRDGLPEILTLFSQTLNDQKPPNLHLLPSYPTPEYEDDGVHLTSFSGLEFVLSLFDTSEELLDNLKLGPLERCNVRGETGRVLEDRVMVLEQDHRRLNKFVENKAAADAELFDLRENERFEDSFVISGLQALASSLTGKEWQNHAISSVQAVIRELMGREMEIIVVQNVTSRQQGAEVTYNVRMASVEDSKSIRRKFGSYFQRGNDSRPPSLKAISIKNRVTSDTKIRISVMKLMAKRYKDMNPDAKVQVVGYEPRPLIKIIPPVGSNDRRTKIYNYIEACRYMPTSFPPSDVQKILRRVNPRHRGHVKSIFIVLHDDMPRSVPSATESASGATSGNVDASVESEAQEANPFNALGEDVEVRRGRRRRASSPPGSPASKR